MAPRFQRVARVDEIPEGAGAPVAVGDRTIAVFNLGGEFYAIDDMCPHRGGSLGCGTVEGGKIICPMHDWKFDIRTGELPMGEGVASYPARVQGDEIWVEL